MTVHIEFPWVLRDRKTPKVRTEPTALSCNKLHTSSVTDDLQAYSHTSAEVATPLISWPCNIRFTAVVSLVSPFANPRSGTSWHREAAHCVPNVNTASGAGGTWACRRCRDQLPPLGWRQDTCRGSESACLCRPARRPPRPPCNTHTPCIVMCTRTPSGMCFPGAVSS